MKTLILSTISLFLFSCTQSKQFSELPAYPYLEKKDILWSGGESTPIIFNDELYYIAVGVDSPYRLDVRDNRGQLLHSHVSNLEYISAYNDNGTVYVVGSNADKSALMITSSTDLINWTTQREVISGQGNKYYNSSITKTDNGFVMAYEVCRNGITCFNAQFLHTVDFVNWQPIGTRIFDGYYTACPTIRYIEGTYYVLFLAHYDASSKHPEYWATLTAKSKDLINWQVAKHQFITPIDGSEEAPNASDVDFIEYNGLVEIIYLNTPQVPIPGKTFNNIGSRRAIYRGTLKKLLEDQFN